MQKILARAGLGSRREAERWIAEGRVTVNGAKATLGTQAQGSDQIRLDGKLIHQASTKRAASYLCHRSPGEPLFDSADSTATALSERLPRRQGKRYIAISPMPTMDGGLEILSADGELAMRLQRAIRRLPVSYLVRVRGVLNEMQTAGLLEGQTDRGAQLAILSVEAQSETEAANHWYRIETRGVAGSDLRRLLERQAVMVGRVMRVSLGNLSLGRDQPRGSFRELHEPELSLLLEPTDKAGTASA